MDTKLNINGIEYSHNDKLQQAMDKATADAEKLFPLFPYPSPFTIIKGEGENLKPLIKFGDESLDDLFGTSGYKVNKGYLKIYHDELVKFEIDEMLEESTDLSVRDIISLVKQTGDLIIEHSGYPTFIQNRILDVLAKCNEYKQVGLIIQVLYLQGILKWFEYCDLNEGDPGSEEAQNLVDWIFRKFEEACLYYFLILRNNNKSKPLTNYLETIEIGQVWKELEIKNNSNLHSLVNETQIIDKTESIESGKNPIIKHVHCLQLFEAFKSSFPFETEESWFNRFIDNPEILKPLEVGNNIAEIVGILAAIHEINVWNNPAVFDAYVIRRWGIKNFSRKKGTLRDKSTYQKSKKLTSEILNFKK